MGVGNDLDLLPHGIENYDGIGDQEIGVIGIQQRGIVRRQPLKVTHHVVAEIADGAPEEARQSFDLYRGKARQGVADGRQGVGDGKCRRSAGFDDLDGSALGTDDQRGAGAEEAVTGPLLTTLDTFEQEGKTPVIQLLKAVTGVSISAMISR